MKMARIFSSYPEMADWLILSKNNNKFGSHRRLLKCFRNVPSQYVEMI